MKLLRYIKQNTKVIKAQREDANNIEQRSLFLSELRVETPNLLKLFFTTKEAKM